MNGYGIKDIKGKSDEVILKKASISGNVCGQFVEIFINQVFENSSNSNLEAVYSFPIPNTAVISSFEVSFGGRTLTAVVEDKSKTVKINEEAEERGENILLLEEFKPHAFQITIGKILPKETINIKLSYIDELIYRDSKFKLTIPAIAAPREIGNSVCNEESSYKLTLNLLVESLCKLSFRSPYYSINVERDGNNLSKISFTGEKNCMEKDFVLFMKEEERLETSGMIYEYKDGDEKRGIVYLRVIPEIDENEKDKNENYVFLIDITESMKGAKLEEAKNALQLCIRNLSEGDTFDIVAMGNELKYFSKEGRLSFNEDNLRKASEWIEELEAYGDTLIYNAIRYSLEGKNKEVSNTILLFTDDTVESETEILDYVKDNIGNSRIFTFGIDSSVNSFFLNKLAQLGYGKAEFIYEGQRIEESVLRQFNRIKNPEVDDVSIDWGNMKVDETFPRTINYMYDREPFSVFGRFLGQIDGFITINGEVCKKDYVRKINLDTLKLEENANLIQKVWCRKRIQSIEERMIGERGIVKEEMKNKVIEISKKYGIISPETSFIVFEHKVEKVLGIEFKNIIPLKVYEKNLSDNIHTESDETPSFLYKNYTHEDKKDGKEFLDYKYPREKILIILAKHQFADGSFSNYNNMEVRNRLEATAMCILAFTVGEEDIGIYINQINKSIEFILKNIEYYKMDEKLYFLIETSFKAAYDKGVIKRKIVESVIELIKNDEQVELKRRLISLFQISNDGRSINENIFLGTEKNSIFDLAKLAILETL